MSIYIGNSSDTHTPMIHMTSGNEHFSEASLNQYLSGKTTFLSTQEMLVNPKIRVVYSSSPPQHDWAMAFVLTPEQVQMVVGDQPNIILIKSAENNYYTFQNLNLYFNARVFFRGIYGPPSKHGWSHYNTAYDSVPHCWVDFPKANVRQIFNGAEMWIFQFTEYTFPANSEIKVSNGDVKIGTQSIADIEYLSIADRGKSVNTLDWVFKTPHFDMQVINFSNRFYSPGENIDKTVILDNDGIHVDRKGSVHTIIPLNSPSTITPSSVYKANGKVAYFYVNPHKGRFAWVSIHCYVTIGGEMGIYPISFTLDTTLQNTFFDVVSFIRYSTDRTLDLYRFCVRADSGVCVFGYFKNPLGLETDNFKSVSTDELNNLHGMLSYSHRHLH